MPSFDLDRLSQDLRPFRLHYFPSLPSTNDQAVTMRKAGELFAPAILLAAEQTAGRGRGANRWFSLAGSLTVTYALPIEEHLQPHQLPLVVGLAVRNAATELTGNTEIGLKWPNDVLHTGAKLAGILCERTGGVDLVGIGLNVNLAPSQLPALLRYGATSLSTIAGQDFDLTRVLLLLTQHLQRMLLNRHSQPFAAFVDAYRRYDALLGRQVTVTQAAEAPIRGTCEGIDPEGWFLLRTSRGLQRIIAGTITLTD